MGRAGDSGGPTAANQFQARLLEHTTRRFAATERLVWTLASGACFHQSNPALCGEGQSIPARVPNTKNIPLEGFKS